MSNVMKSYFLGVVLLTAAIALAVVELALPPDRASSPPGPAMMWTPCGELITGRDSPSEDSPLVWFFGETLVPSDLVALSSGVGRNCMAGYSGDAGRRDYSLAAYFTFFVGEGDAREIAVWWLFYPDWEDPEGYRSELRQMSDRGTVTFNDGYIVAVSPDASDEVRRAAEATPDTDVWQVVYAQSVAE